EHLVPRAAVRRQRAPQADLDLLVILLRRVSAEHPRLDLLILAPGARQQGGRIGVRSLAHRTMRDAVLGDDVVPVDPVLPTVEPLPALRDGIFVKLESGAVGPLGSRFIRLLGRPPLRLPMGDYEI